MLGLSQSRGPKLFGCEIIFKEFQPMCCWYLNVTDRRTDGRTDRQTDGRLTVALPLSALASRGKKEMTFALHVHTNIRRIKTKVKIKNTMSRVHIKQCTADIDNGWLRTSELSYSVQKNSFRRVPMGLSIARMYDRPWDWVKEDESLSSWCTQAYYHIRKGVGLWNRCYEI